MHIHSSKLSFLRKLNKASKTQSNLQWSAVQFGKKVRNFRPLRLDKISSLRGAGFLVHATINHMRFFVRYNSRVE